MKGGGGGGVVVRRGGAGLGRAGAGHARALIEGSRWLQSVAASQRSRCWSRGRGLPGRRERSRRADERQGAPLQLRLCAIGGS